MSFLPHHIALSSTTCEPFYLFFLGDLPAAFAQDSMQSAFTELQKGLLHELLSLIGVNVSVSLVSAKRQCMMKKKIRFHSLFSIFLF